MRTVLLVFVGVMVGSDGKWLGRLPSDFTQKMADDNVILVTEGFISASHYRHRRTTLTLDFSDLMPSAFRCDFNATHPHTSDVCRMSLASRTVAVDRGNRMVSWKLWSIQVQCQEYAELFASTLREQGTLAKLGGLALGLAARRKRELFSLAAIALVFAVTALFSSAGGVIYTASVDGKATLALSEARSTHESLQAMITNGATSMVDIRNSFKELHNLTLANRRDITNLRTEVGVVSPIITVTYDSFSDGISHLVNQMRLLPSLMKPADAWKIAQMSLPPQLAAEMIFSRLPTLFSQVAFFLPTIADPINLTLTGELTYPLVAEATLYHLVEPVHTGFFCANGTAYCLPSMPEYVAIPIGKEDVSASDIRYADVEDCLVTHHKLYICKAGNVKKSPPADCCTVPISGPCPITQMRAASDFAFAQEVGDAWIVATKLSFFTVHTKNSEKNPNVPVKKLINIYHPPSDGSFQFGAVSIHGRSQKSVRVPHLNNAMNHVGLDMEQSAWDPSSVEAMKKDIFFLDRDEKKLKKIGEADEERFQQLEKTYASGLGMPSWWMIIAGLGVFAVFFFACVIFCKSKRGQGGSSHITNNFSSAPFSAPAPAV